jgi:hypothetical protein
MLFQNLIQDVAYGALQLRRSPLFALTTILTIAISNALRSTLILYGRSICLRSLPRSFAVDEAFDGIKRR